MIPAATWPRERPEDERLLRIDPARGHFTDARIADLPAVLAHGDLVVVNDAATVPASLRALRDGGTPFEVRLLSHDGRDSTQWRAILFGRGDWRVRTDDRPPPPRLDEGERFRVAGGVAARVVAVDGGSPRLVRIAFEGSAAGLSSSGDAALDARLPLDERYDLPEPTVDAVERTRAAGGRIVAVGTTVVRALEGCADAHAARSSRARAPAISDSDPDRGSAWSTVS
jgi:hypothetical protein